MGGVWEQQIRSVRAVLSTLVREHGHILDDESFRTLLAEVECIMNSRPLTFPSSDPRDPQPLTPNHIMTMKSKLSCHHLEAFSGTTYTYANVADESSTWLIYFGPAGEKSISKVCNPGLNGINYGEILNQEL